MARLLSQAGRVAVVLAVVFGLIDLWQVAILHPGFLSAANVLSLVALYLAGGFVTALVLLAAGVVGRRRDPALVAPGVLGVLLAAGAFLVAEELVFLRVPPLSPGRTWAVLGLGLAAGASVVPLVRLAWRVRVPRWGLAAALVLVAVGGLGAAGGFTARRAEPAAPAGSATGPATRPNVLLITIDTLRADHLSCYGYGRATSPAIDAFARDGVLFARAFAQSSWTKPSTASLLTSHYPSMHQANLREARIADAEVLLPEVLHDGGYVTAVMSGNPWVTPEYGFGQGVDYFSALYEERFARATLLMTALNRVNRLVDRNATVYNLVKRRVQGELSTTARDVRLGAEAARWLGQPRQRPAFLYVHLMSPHQPYDPPPPFDRAFVTDPQDPPVILYPQKGWFFFEHGAPLSPAKYADMVGRYDGNILFADTVVGKLLAELGRQGVLERTIVVLTADHGEEFYDHQNWGHGQSVYNELLHVPLIVRYPAALPKGKRIEQPVMSVDVMPTVLELAAVPAPQTLAGRSLVPLMQDNPWPHEAEVFSEVIYRYGRGRALISGEKKLIETTVGDQTRRLFYDLATDPGETHDLMGDHADPLAYERRLAALQAWAEQHRINAAEAHVSEEMENRLKALGYVN